VEGRRRALNRNVKVAAPDNKPVTLRVSVFTPTFNRAGKLHRVFDSLLAQTCPHSWFEWVIVDDGSNDDTDKVVKNFVSRADFPIIYRYQQNQGKHIAHNRALELAQGEFFLKCDSDDAFDSTAINYFIDTWSSLSETTRRGCSGITVRCRNQYGRIVTPKIRGAPIIANNSERVILLGITGDLWGIVRTEVAREFPFPEWFSGSHYPELIQWNKLGRKYKELFTNEVLYTIFYDANNSITRSELANNSFRLADKGLRECADYLNNDLRLFWRRPLFFIKRALMFNYFQSYIGGRELARDQFLTQRASWWCLLFRPLNPLARLLLTRRLAKRVS
jgi:glycosyltransferase involved in cell wall biosynthesis